MEELEEDEGKGNKRENQEEEENVVAIEEVIGFVMGVIKPEGFEVGEIPAEGGLGGGEGVKRQHRVEESTEAAKRGERGEEEEREGVKLMREF